MHAGNRSKKLEGESGNDLIESLKVLRGQPKRTFNDGSVNGNDARKSEEPMKKLANVKWN